jgi:predicted outer membrane protein
MSSRSVRAVVTLLVVAIQGLVVAGVATAQSTTTPTTPRGTPSATAPARTDTPGADQGWTQTRWGPLGPADRKLIEKVALAGLWEGPIAEQGSQRGNSQIVRQTGAELHSDHAFLDQETGKIATQLAVRLPDKPSDEQAGWMSEIGSKQGPEYDLVWAQRLRAAHGQIFQLIGQVRSGTRNDMIRAYAQTANKFVEKHMALLEKTGKVDFQGLPPAELPGASTAAVPTAPAVDRTAVRSPTDDGLGMTIFFGLLVITALAFGAITVFRRSQRVR